MAKLDEIIEKESFLLQIINAVSSGIIVTDLEHNILLINQAGAGMAGMTPGDCFDRKCYEIFKTPLCGTENCGCTSAGNSKKIITGETFFNVDGRDLPVMYTAKPLLNSRDETIGCVEHFIDMTEYHKKEEIILQQNEEVLRLLSEKTQQSHMLNRANAELLQLSQDIEALAHEHTLTKVALEVADLFKNPIFVIGGLLQAIGRELPETIRTGEKFRACIDALSKLEQALKKFEKIYAEHQSFFIYEDLRTIVYDAIKVWQANIGMKEIHLSIQMSSQPIIIRSDRRTLKIALLHVMRNAYDVSRKQGTIEIWVDRDEQDRPFVKVVDHGNGIPEEIKKDLFEKIISTKATGRGVGLIMVHQIVSEHQGEIELKSEIGQGTEIIFRFPLRWKER